jgi:glycosyltransferase involved in cell wall biosynthesis
VSKRVIAFVINSIGAGGAERALATILEAAGARRDRFDIHLVLLDDEPPMRPMPDWVVRHVLDSRGDLLRSVVGLTRTLRPLRPALTVSLLVRANLSTALAARAAGSPSILCERMHLSSHLEDRYRGWRLATAKALPRLLYPLATKVLGVSSEVAEDLVERFGVAREAAGVIFNPYDLERIRAEAQAPLPTALPDRFLLGVGRFVPAKNFDQLIECYLASGVEPDLVLMGDGPERPRLEQLIARRNAGARVRLLPYQANPFPVMAGAEAYVSASRNEGFPNAMVEAMALGVPVVASDCRSGPSEILAGVAHRVATTGLVEAPHGVLVPEGDGDALIQAMHLMADAPTRRAYGERAKLRSWDFRAELVAEQYWSLFETLARP